MSNPDERVVALFAMSMKNLTLTILILLPYGLCHAETGGAVPAPDSWAKTQHGVTFSLSQIPADSVGAFYIGRGFTLDQIRPYMDTCVFTAVLRNDSAPGRIHYVRDHWRVIVEEESQALVPTSIWLDRFRENSIPDAALIAFRLAQLPEEQEYETGGDWNQGMLSVNLPSGSHFDMIVRWDIQGEPYEMSLQSIICD
jgi:hypothetical protein